MHVGFWSTFVFSLGPLLMFIILMIVIYFLGSSKNKALRAEIEEFIYSGLRCFASEINRVQIRPDEYEYRCTSKIKGIKILTVHLKMVNRSFIIQWLINFIVKDKERLFIGMKFGSRESEDDPVYKFDAVPYRRKFFIRQRFETFVELDDIAAISNGQFQPGYSGTILLISC